MDNVNLNELNVVLHCCLDLSCNTKVKSTEQSQQTRNLFLWLIGITRTGRQKENIITQMSQTTLDFV